MTCIGGYAPVYVAEEIHNNAFKIGGGTPGLKVSWQVTGIRQDKWANDNRIPVEQAKPADEIGTYLYPQGFDSSEAPADLPTPNVGSQIVPTRESGGNIDLFTCSL